MNEKTVPLDWYQRVRMAVFDPQYLATHQQINRADLDLLIDTILQMREAREGAQ